MAGLAELDRPDRVGVEREDDRLRPLGTMREPMLAVSAMRAESALRGDRFEQRRLAAAVLADEEGDGALEVEPEFAARKAR